MALATPKKSEKSPYLEKVINCNLAKTSRILRLMGFHADDLNIKPSNTVYKRKARGGKVDLIFSKIGEPNIEKAYSRHFVKIGGTQSANKKIEPTN